MEIIDITVPIRPDMPVYDRNPGRAARRASQAIEDDASANVSELELGVHSGTHVDAPLHFIESGDAAETLPLEVLIGPAARRRRDVPGGSRSTRKRSTGSTSRRTRSG